MIRRSYHDTILCIGTQLCKAEGTSIRRECGISVIKIDSPCLDDCTGLHVDQLDSTALLAGTVHIFQLPAAFTDFYFEADASGCHIQIRQVHGRHGHC